MPSEVPATIFSGGAFISLDMTSFHIPVATGESFAIALQSNELSGSGSIYSWEIAAGDPYAGGNLFLSPDSGINFYPTGSPSGSSDVGFRTYVNVSPVPEPEVYAMLLAGLGLIGFMMRKRRKCN